MAQLFLNGQSLGPIDGVLFDKDGTLSHSEPKLLALVRQRISTAKRLWQEKSGDKPSSTADRPYQLQTLLEQVYGVQGDAIHPAGTLAVAARQDNLASMATVFCLMGSGWPEALALATRCFAEDQSEPGPASALLPGADRVLQQCRQAKVCTAIISNDTADGINRFLEQHQLCEQISDCWSADDTPRKPDPQAVLSLCERLQLLPERCALIGDADTDLEMAKAAGIGVVLGYRGGWRQPAPLTTTPHLFDDWSAVTITVGP